MSTKQNALFDAGSCLNKADAREPIFVLRANDPLAGQAIRHWATMAEGHHEPSKVNQARELADAMDKWRDSRSKVAEDRPART